MVIYTNLTSSPGLFYHIEWDRWVLSMSDGSSFWMVIDQDYDTSRDPDSRYRYIMWNDGEWIEAITRGQYEERLQAIEEHEGAEVAALWSQHQEQVFVLHDNHVVFSLRKHWEALMALDLFRPSVTHKPWQGKALPEWLQGKMDEARDRWMMESAAEIELENRSNPVGEAIDFVSKRGAY